jgi:hypothetical protein
MGTSKNSIDETIRRIEECRSWMVFKNVERDPAYRALLDTCLDQAREHSEFSITFRTASSDRREVFVRRPRRDRRAKLQ